MGKAADQIHREAVELQKNKAWGDATGGYPREYTQIVASHDAAVQQAALDSLQIHPAPALKPWSKHGLGHK